MKHLKRLGVISALVMTALSAVAGSAQATQLTPTGAEVTFHSSNSLLSVTGGGTVRCANSSVTGTIPATSATWVTVPITLTYSSCLGNSTLPATVSQSAGCHGASQPILHVMGIGSNQAMGTVTIPSGCSITAHIASIGCTFTINGPQTVGDDTIGFGGGHFTGGSDPIIHLNSSTVRDIVVDGPTSAACATAVNHTATGTLTGAYTGTGTVDVDG